MCRTDESPDQGLARVLVQVGLVVRDMQTSKKKKKMVLGGQMALFFCLPWLIAPERRAILSNVSLAGVEGHLTHCGQGSWVPRAPVSDTYQDNKLITGSWCLPVGQLLRPNAAPAGHHNWEHSQPLFICLGYCNKIPHMGPLKQQAFILS